MLFTLSGAPDTTENPRSANKPAPYLSLCSAVAAVKSSLCSSRKFLLGLHPPLNSSEVSGKAKISDLVLHLFWAGVNLSINRSE